MLIVQEPNFHVLYLELMEKMNKVMMDKHLATTTYKYIKILLRSDRIKTHVSAALFAPHYICCQANLTSNSVHDIDCH